LEQPEQFNIISPMYLHLLPWMAIEMLTIIVSLLHCGMKGEIHDIVELKFNKELKVLARLDEYYHGHYKAYMGRAAIVRRLTHCLVPLYH
jgi:hypothetical protein